MTAPAAMLSYEVSQEDYVNAALLSARITRRALIRHAGVVIICAGMIGYAGGVTEGIGAIILIPIIMVLVREGIRWLYVPYKARREYKLYRRLKHNGQIGLVPEGLRFADDDSNVLLRWEQFLSWRHSGKTTIIYTAPRVFIQLPERLAADGFDTQAVRHQLQQTIGKPI